MSDPTSSQITEAAKALASAAGSGRGWLRRVARTAPTVATEEHSLIEESLRSENLARKVAASASRRNAAGVFGPSQAGKSYLVSVLGRSRDGELEADFAGVQRNFIREINPEGGKESTGLVTRFTTVKGTGDTAFPVELRLLSETDLVKILGNSFMSDFDHHKRSLALQSEEAIRSAIQRLEGSANARVAHLDEVAMFDIGEYFKANFATTIEPLSRAGFWDALVRIGHRLALPQRTSLFSLIWGETRELTELFALLLKALEDLRHAATVRAPMTCLLPRQQSIIDVETLKQRLGTPQDAQDVLEVVAERAGGDESPVPITRATLCALVAEIKVVMASQPWRFFEHTDVLDFPGARAREQMIDLPHDPTERQVAIRNMLLRGKIAYLFQRYTDDRELPCILLCMPPGNQEVKDLTGLARRWVEQTHGRDARARANATCALFFVLTKLDEDMRSKPGDTPDSLRSRIETRLEASVNQLFKQEDWLQDWDGKPFANTLFLRNPGFRLEEVFQYEPGSEGRSRPTESGILPAVEPRIALFREGMMASAACKRHFSGGAAALDAALVLNDGGITHLVERLERVLSATLKAGQLRDRLRDQTAQLDARLRRLYRAQDDESRREKEDLLKSLRKDLARSGRQTRFRSFFQYLSLAKLPEEEARAIFLNVASLKAEALASAATPAGGSGQSPAADDDDDAWADLLAGSSGGQKAAVEELAPVQDRYDIFAVQAIDFWIDRARALAANPLTARTLGIDARVASDLGNELVIGAHRNGLASRIAAKVRTKSASANVRWDDVASSAACIASMMINDYVAYLGYGDLPEADRPAYPEPPAMREKAVFAAPPLPGPNEVPKLGSGRLALEVDYFLQWGTALTPFGLSNAAHAGGRDINEEDNAALGAVLATLRQSIDLLGAPG